jgi:Xaa-Pro aminopeptidase
LNRDVAQKSASLNSGRSRIDRLRLSVSKARADALLVTHLPNIKYLCGFSGSAGILLVEASRATLFTDSRYTLQAREQVHDTGVSIARQGLIRAVGEALRRSRGRLRLGYAPAQMTVAQKEALQSFAGKRVRWISAAGEVERLRAIKDAGELALMREAALLISDVWSAALPEVRPGVSELAVAAALENAMKLRGASGPCFETIVASGPRSAWPHAQPTSKLLKKNELVVLDQGAILRGYCSDMTRTVFLGRAAGSRVRGLYGAVLEAQQAAKAAIRPGAKAGDVDSAARKILRRHGFVRYFTHSTGHGLGIEVHEIPRLGTGEQTLLEEGMVITVEPGVYIESLGGIRIEDDVVVTARGAEDLTTASRDFLEL